MLTTMKTRGSMLLALGAALLLAGPLLARNPIPSDEPPTVQTPPVTHTTDFPPDNPPSTPPGGTTQHAPEPVTLVSGLIGVGLLSFWSRRRKQQPAAQ
jgi:hypothetical protein